MQQTKSKSIFMTVMASVLLFAAMLLLTACGGPTTTEVSTYDELQQALAGDSEVIKLTDDIVVEDVITVTREVTLDLNGKTLSNETALWDDQTPGANKWSVISVREGGNLTITGNGTIHALENDCYAVDVMDAGKLVIENGTFIGNVSAVYIDEGTVEIKGGEYSIQQLSPQNDYRFTLNCNDTNYEAKTATFIVTGGTFEHFDPANNLAEKGESTNFVADGYVSQVAEGTTDTYVVTKAK